MTRRCFRAALVPLGFLVAACSSGSPDSQSSNSPPRQVQIQDCIENFYSLKAALSAYEAHRGSFPALPEPWSAATYNRNFGPLLAHQGGGPFLPAALDPSHYVMEYDPSGNVWVESAGVYDQSVNRAHASYQACSSVIP